MTELVLVVLCLSWCWCTAGVMEVIVLDKPSPPEGPLQYDDVTSSTVTLSWKPPKDDGGSPIT